MASGHYETRRVINTTGIGPDYKDVRVWVPDPAPSAASKAAKSKVSSAVRAKAAAAAKAKAAAAAKAAAVAKATALARATASERQQALRSQADAAAKVREARHASYENLQAQQVALLNKTRLVAARSGQTTSTTAPVSAVAPKQARLTDPAEQRYMRRARTNAAPSTISTERLVSSQQQHWEGVAYQYQKQQVVNSPAASISDMEAILAKEAERAASGSIDAGSVGKIAEKYVKAAEDVASKYTALVNQINAAIDAKNITLAKTLYFGKDFKELAAAYTHLFGDGTDPRKDGSFNAFFASYGKIEQAQTDYWKRQMKATLDADSRKVHTLLDEARASGDAEAIKQYEQLVAIYDGKTSSVQSGTKDDGRPTYRKLTVEEELQKREAERRIEMERLRAQFDAQQNRQHKLARAEGLVEGKGGQLITPTQRTIEDYASQIVASRYGGTAPKLSRPQDLADFADQIVRSWDARNKSAFFSGVAQFDGKGYSAAYRQAQQNYEAARAKFESETYGYFGSSTPQWWDRLFSTPGVSHAVSSLQAGVSSIGGLIRVGNAWVFGETKVGGYQPDLSQLPSSVVSAMDAAEKSVTEGIRQSYASGSITGGRLDGSGYDAPIQAARDKVLKDWLATSAGQAWASDQTQGQKQKGYDELKSFSEGFYGAGDLGSKLDALNKFGSEPFNTGASNLLFQLLADPTNAIPLKFTTYLARAKYAAELGGASKFLGSAKLGTVRDFIKVDEGTLKLRKELGDLLKRGGQDGRSARQLTDELLAEVAGVTERSAGEKAIRAKLVAAGIDPRLVNDTQIFSLVENAVRERLAREGVDYASQSDAIKARLAEEEAARKAAETKRAQQAAKREATRRQGQSAREAAGKQAQVRLSAAKQAEEAALADAAKSAKTTPVAGVGEPPVVGAARGATGQPPAPAKARFITPQAEVKGKPTGTARVATRSATVSPTERKLAATMRVQEPKSVRAVSGEARRIRRATEYYKPDAMGNWLPKESQVMASKRYRALAKAAREGDVAAQTELARIARQRRNTVKTQWEDMSRSSPFTQTDFDLAERAGVVGDAKATANLITDRETIRHLKRVAGAKPTTGGDNYLREFVRDPGQAIARDFGAQDALPSGQRVNIGDDVIAARDSIRGLNDAYETFSGLPNRTRYYSGGYFDLVRDPKWRANLDSPTFAKLLTGLDQLDELYGLGGVAGFRDGGQILFELFHGLRLDGNVEVLQRMSSFVDAHLGALADPADSLFGWQWKVMEERAGIPWAWDAALAEDGFLRAAERANMHPNLAMSMIPNGFYAHRAPNRFRLSATLLGMADSPIFKAAPSTWVESDALAAVTATFTKAVEGNATRVVHYTAERFGSFAKAFKLRNRILDELTHAVRNEMTSAELTKVLVAYADELPELAQVAERLGKPLDEIISKELGKKTGLFPNGTPKRPEYAPLRDAVQRAYWDGKVALTNPEAHKLMLLGHLQDNPKSWIGATSQFVDYMVALGKVEDAKAFVGAVFRDRIDRLGARYAAERLGQIEHAVDAVTGEVRDLSATAEWKLWDDLGFTPDTDRVRAWLDNVQRGEVVATDGSDARKLKQLGQYDNEEEMIRDLVGRHERDTGPLAYTGGTDPAWLTDRVRSKIAKYQRTHEPADLVKAVGDLQWTVDRVLRQGVGGDELQAVKALIADMAKIPEGKALVQALGARVGDEVLLRWLNLSGEFPLYRKFKVRPGKAAAKAKVEPKVAVKIEPVAPAPTAAQMRDIASAEAALRAVTGQTEEQYWKTLAARNHAILKNPASSVAEKAQARAVLADIDKARYAKRLAASNGNFIPSSERSRFRNRVVSEHGREAEELIAPKQIAPYVEDAEGLAVEHGRTLYRTLRSAQPDDLPSRVTGVARNGKRVDHLPMEVFERLDEAVSDAIAEARGVRAETRTRGRRPGSGPDQKQRVSRYKDGDPKVIAAKTKALAEFSRAHGWQVSVDAYDEARRVLWKGHVQNKSGLWLMNRANEIVARFGGEYKDVFQRLRSKAAREEGRRQLSILSWGEMYGHAPSEVMAEFLARYGDDGQLRGFQLQLSAFQRRTLEEHLKTLSGVKDLTDENLMSAWLMSRNAPPLHSRDAVREFLTDIGAWSPRRADQFTAGTASWSVTAEADYWRSSYGLVPEWADVQRLGTDFADIFHDQGLYYSQMRAWGVFDRQAEIQLRLSGKSAAEIEEAVLHGDAALGLKGKRELDLQRRYVIERYGDLVADGDRLTAMPWLMYPDELRSYMSKRYAKGMGLADGLVQNADELAQVEQLIGDTMNDFWDKYIGTKAADGPIMYEDIFRLGSEIQARLLADPKWAKRYRDTFVGGALNAWAEFNRALVFSQLSFAVTNIVDSPIKGAWYRFTRRSLFNPGLVGASEEVARAAEALTPHMLGIDAETTIYRLKQRTAADSLLRPLKKGPAGLAERLTALRGAWQWAPELAGRAEVAMKMRLARGMYPAVYEQALAKLGDKALADAFARKFIKEEVVKMWPVSGSGPLEKLFNRIVPFASYMVRNKVLFISEAVAHPSILNQIEYIGRFIEQHNRAEWENEHPGEPLPDAYARRIELPWAPGYFLDLGQFSDATRGLKPIFNAQKAQSFKDFVAQWVRIVNPSAQAGIYMLTNALGITQRVMWVPNYNSAGFITGYTRTVTGWTEPWSQDQPTLSSIFWMFDGMESAQALGAGGFTLGELSQLIGKVALFDAVSKPDRGSGLFELYKALRERNAESAAKWLATTPDGQYLQEWLLVHRDASKPFKDWFSLVNRWDIDPNRWFHTQTPEFQKRVGDAYGQINAIRTSYEARLLALTPGTAEYKQTKADMLFYISEVYRLTPELMVHEVYSKSASAWSKQLASWQTNMKMDEFFALDDQRPKRADFATSEAYAVAVDKWKHQKEIFLAQYPQVAQAIGGARTEYQRVRDQVEAEWDGILTRIGKRNDLIDAAKAAGDFRGADLLRLQNELDYTLLEHDRVALYFTDADFKTLPDGMVGSPTLRDRALATATSILDFDRRRYEKAVREGRGEAFLADLRYSQGMRDVILKAKGGDPFGTFDPGRFVAELRKRPGLLAQYFAKNPGKERAWGQSDAYATAIGRWGKLAAAGKWDEAEKAWTALPQWVKDKYYANHPDRAKKAVETAAFAGWMQRWTAYFDANDSKGGMTYFWQMPEWVRERYFKAHPDKRVKWEGQLKYGAQLTAYFATAPADQPAYLLAHPDLQVWMAHNVTSAEGTRQAILAGYAAIPKTEPWLRRIYREKYPDVFSQAAIGERKLSKVYDQLATHPDALPGFEKWRDSIWATYNDMLRHSGARPRELRADHSRVTRGKSRSAEQTSR